MRHACGTANEGRPGSALLGRVPACVGGKGAGVSGIEPW
jgi:hypothetical protein